MVAIPRFRKGVIEEEVIENTQWHLVLDHGVGWAWCCTVNYTIELLEAMH